MYTTQKVTYSERTRLTEEKQIVKGVRSSSAVQKKTGAGTK